MINIRSRSLTDDQWRNHPNYVCWYIIFEPRRTAYWVDRFLDLRFSHVSAVKWDGFNWIAVTPLSGYTSVEVLPFFNQTDLKHIVKNRRYVKVETICHSTRLRIPWFISTYSCVDEIKGLLGIRNPLIITPLQLYRYLFYRVKIKNPQAKPRAEKARNGSIAGNRTAESGD